MAQQGNGAFFGMALLTTAVVLIDAAVTGRSVIGVIQNAPHGSSKVAGPTSNPNSAQGIAQAVGANVGVTATGTAAGVVQAAKQALANKGNYEYAEVRPMPASLFGKPPIRTDCSGFATLCYKAAGLPDPNNLGYSGLGNTTTLQAFGKQTITPQAGDLAFYDNPAHVTVVVGDGSCISMGGPGDPVQLPVTYRTVTQYRTYVSGKAKAKKHG